jgi:hypothetical protein
MNTTKWTAWHRANPDRPWRLLGEAANEADAWRLMLDGARGGDKTVCRPGVNPNDRPEQRRARAR